jgi:hypothetical protein
MTNPIPITRAHKAPGFDKRRITLARRIKILTAVTDVTMTQIASEVPVTPVSPCTSTRWRRSLPGWSRMRSRVASRSRSESI